MKKLPTRRQRLAASSIIVFAWLAWGASARADEMPGRMALQTGPTSVDETTDQARAERPRIGAVAGIGFPTPLSIEAMGMIGNVVSVGAEYGLLPTTTINGVQASLWTLAGDVRVFPTHGPFFVGLRFGYQHAAASTTIFVSSDGAVGVGAPSGSGPTGSAPEELSLDSWFVNPRIGFLWRWESGLALGIDAGVEVPLATNISSTVPLSLVPSTQQAIETLGTTALPTVDLLRVGFLL